MDQAVLVDTDVYEGAESGDVGDHAGQLHTGVQVVERADVFGEAHELEALPRVASRLRQLGQNVAQGR